MVLVLFCTPIDSGALHNDTFSKLNKVSVCYDIPRIQNKEVNNWLSNEIIEVHSMCLESSIVRCFLCGCLASDGWAYLECTCMSI